MQAPLLEVGILHCPHNIQFNLLQPCNLTETGETISSGNYVATHNPDGIRFNHQTYPSLTFTGMHEGDCFELCEVKIGISFHWERVETEKFEGKLKIIQTQQELIAINLISIEKYLISVISSEMSATASLALLQAHAVISRSWVMAQLHKKGKNSKQIPPIMPHTTEISRWYGNEEHTHYQVCADDHCQRYYGNTRATQQKVKEAVTQTQGEILTYQGRLCDTRYSKCCGGITEQYESCWEPTTHPYLTPVTDNKETKLTLDLTQEEAAKNYILHSIPAFCDTNDPEILAQVLNGYDNETPHLYRWEVTYSQIELKELISRKLGIETGNIIALNPLSRGASGRITRLQIVAEKRTIIVGKELEIRRILSPSHLYSSAFFTTYLYDTEETIPTTFTLHGAGWGHGVGLCQIGAAVMGKQGYNYQQILQHYFKGAEIKKLY